MAEDHILRIAKYLRAVIPPPPPPPRRMQKSFASLSEGQHVENLQDLVVGGIKFPAGTRWEVKDPCNLGVTLLSLPGQGFDHCYPLPMGNKDWKTQFKRVRRPSKRKKKA